jgi:hypothetical protein
LASHSWKANGYSHKGDATYVHILRWSTKTVALPAIASRIVRHGLLTGGSAAFTQSQSGVEVTGGAAAAHGRNACSAAWLLRRPQTVENFAWPPTLFLHNDLSSSSTP